MAKAAVKAVKTTTAKSASKQATTAGTLQPVFDALKPVFTRQADKMDILTDKPGDYYLVSRTLVHNKRPVWFGGLSIKKNYVSVHVFPLYAFPELLDTLSPELKKRMQGKACFNFKTMPEKATLAELTALSDTGVKWFAEKKLRIG